jgi:superfamily II RNA helicase
MSVIIHSAQKKFTGDPPPLYMDFSFQLDHFQLWGCQAIENKENILITAHTGSGKTVLALHAISKYLAVGKRVIYTSPIKTLSNQKYAEFSAKFPSVGVLTGDIKVNPDASCLIMTAEILRNFLTSTECPSYFSMKDVSCVILDEVHFINNKERGRVWEEILVHLPRDIQLVMLSATISGAEQFAGWIAQLKNINCHLISTAKRPVPLAHSVFWDGKLHHFLKNDEWKRGVWTEQKKDIEKYYRGRSFTNHQFHECLHYLERENLLPATVFILNRELVEKTCKTLLLTQKDPDKLHRIDYLWNKHLLKYRAHYEHTEQWILLYDLVRKGVGIHHSGLIPVLKEIVEILYTEGLLLVLLATETFALGVNAPTRTVVFTNLQKFDGKIKRTLFADEYNQMAGRAGRRGLDPLGEVIIVPHPYMMNEDELHKMILSPPPILKSRLSLDYSVLMKLFPPQETMEPQNIREILSKTFFYQQEERAMESVYEKKRTATPLDKIKTPDLEAYWVDFQTIKALEVRMAPMGGIARLDKKMEKKLSKEKKTLEAKIPPDVLRKLETVWKAEQDRSELNETLFAYESQWRIQWNVMKGFFKHIGIIQRDQWSRRGIIMKNLHEGNQLWMSHLLETGALVELDTPALVAVLSLFLADPEKEDFEWSGTTLSDPERDFFKRAKELCDAEQDLEIQFMRDLPYPFYNNWELSRTMYRAARDWIAGESWAHIRTYYGDFEGNFVKNMIRIYNFCLNVREIGRIIQCVPLIQKLDSLENLVFRDMVIQDSLYI